MLAKLIKKIEISKPENSYKSQLVQLFSLRFAKNIFNKLVLFISRELLSNFSNGQNKTGYAYS
jgi:hypothetical protein